MSRHDDIDVIVRNEGTIFVVTPVTQEAHEWIDEHVDSAAMWFGGGLIVEHRFIHDLVDGMECAGLTVRGQVVVAA